MYKKTISLYYEENITGSGTANMFANTTVKNLITTLKLTDKNKKVYNEKWVKQSNGTYKKDTSTDLLGDFHSILYNGTFNDNIYNLIKTIVDNGKTSYYLLLIAERNSRMVLKYGSLTSQYNPLVKLRGQTTISY